jgi:hypothetical protein
MLKIGENAGNFEKVDKILIYANLFTQEITLLFSHDNKKQNSPVLISGREKGILISDSRLRKSVDPSLIDEIEAELHRNEATSPAESVTEMGSPAADKQLGNRWFRWFTGKKEIPVPARDPSLSAKVELLEAFLAFLKAVEMVRDFSNFWNPTVILQKM